MREKRPDIVARSRVGRAANSRGLRIGAPPGLRLAHLEAILLFLAAPLAVLGAGGVWSAPLVANAMLTAAAVLLSMTPAFRWRDLAPVDFWSEWRVLAAMGAAASAISALLAAAGFGGAPGTASGLAVYCLCAIPAVELVYRVLFLRRYAALFGGDAAVIAACALTNGLAFAAAAPGVWAGAFGLGVGAALAFVYLRTGGFLLSVACHAVIAAAFWRVGLAPF